MLINDHTATPCSHKQKPVSSVTPKRAIQEKEWLLETLQGRKPN